MNEAIWQFRLFERASLNYLGSDLATSEPDRLGLWDRTEPAQASAAAPTF
jgi:hypothetical protein